MTRFALTPGRGFYFAAFALSGFSGLMYESIWTHYIKLFLGHAAYAQTLVLATFMVGLAIGSWLASRHSPRWRNPLLVYAVVEAAIGLAALAFHWLFVASTAWSYDALLPGLGSPAAAQVYKWVLSAAFILPQSILLGMTFPLLGAGVIRRFSDRPGRTLALLYFTNSFGAACGLLATGFYFVGAFGLPGTMMIAGAINLAVALAVSVSAARPPGVASQASLLEGAPGAPDRLVRWLLVAAGITGAASFLYEIAWIRMLSLVLGSATRSFELMLSAFILGLALGGLWIRRRIDRLENPVRFLGGVQVAMGLLALATLPMYSASFNLMQFFVAALEKSAGGYYLFHLSSHLICLLVMLPATFCAGITLPLMTYLLLGRGAGERAIGAVYAANTVGAIVGVLLAVHVLMPAVGTKGVVTVGAVADIGLGLALLASMWAACGRPQLARFALVSVAGVVLTVSAVRLDQHKLVSGVYRTGQAYMNEDVKVRYLRDGKTATVGLVEWPDGTLTISTNGKQDAGLHRDHAEQDDPTMVLAGALPLLLDRDAKTAANIGMGSGLTSHVLLSTPQLTRLDTIEIESFMVEAAEGFRPRVERTFTDPRSHITIEDAKAFLSTRAVQYDIIVSEPSNPWVSGVSSLFSQEFYGRVRKYIKPGGLLVQWIQLYEIDLPLVASVMKALSPEFSDYVVYITNDRDLLLVARNGGEIPQIDPDAIRQAGLTDELRRINVVSSADLEARRIGSKRILDPFFQSYPVPANSDFAPYLDQNASRTRYLAVNARDLGQTMLNAHPVLEMMDARRPVSGAAHTLASPYVAKAQAVADATRLRGAILSQDFSTLPAQLGLAAVPPALLLEQCGASVTPNLSVDSLLQLSGRLVPHLSPEELRPIWAKFESGACFQRLDPRMRQWLELVKAVSERDAGRMADLGDTLLAYADLTGMRRAYAVRAALLGTIASKQYLRTRDLWLKYRPDANAAQQDITLRLMLAYAQRELKAEQDRLAAR